MKNLNRWYAAALEHHRALDEIYQDYRRCLSDEDVTHQYPLLQKRSLLADQKYNAECVATGHLKQQVYLYKNVDGIFVVEIPEGRG